MDTSLDLKESAEIGSSIANNVKAFLPIHNISAEIEASDQDDGVNSTSWKEKVPRYFSRCKKI